MPITQLKPQLISTKAQGNFDTSAWTYDQASFTYDQVGLTYEQVGGRTGNNTMGLSVGSYRPQETLKVQMARVGNTAYKPVGSVERVKP